MTPYICICKRHTLYYPLVRKLQSTTSDLSFKLWSSFNVIVHCPQIDGIHHVHTKSWQFYSGSIITELPWINHSHVNQGLLVWFLASPVFLWPFLFNFWLNAKHNHTVSYWRPLKLYLRPAILSLWQSKPLFSAIENVVLINPCLGGRPNLMW